MKRILLLISVSLIILIKGVAQTIPTPIKLGKSEVITKEYLLGKFDYTIDTGFVPVPAKFTQMPRQYLRKEVLLHFIAMADDAKKDKVNLFILSSTRNFDEQKQIWEDKWTGKTLVNGKNLTMMKDTILRAKEILKYSAMPSASRHHWGTDVDLDNFNNAFFDHGEGLKVYDWLTKNAHHYGFCNPYNAKGINHRTGYEEERWHWSYYPIANAFMERYFEDVNYEDIKGFLGAGTEIELGIIKNYLLSINEDCK